MLNIFSCVYLPSVYSLEKNVGSSLCGSVVMNLTSIHEDAGSIPGLSQWVKDLASICCRSSPKKKKKKRERERMYILLFLDRVF